MYFKINHLYKSSSKILYGIVPESLRTETRRAGKRDKTSQGPYTQPETISTEMQRHFGPIRAGNTGHGFIKHLPRLRDHTARNTAGDPAPIRKGKAAEKNKPSSETLSGLYKPIQPETMTA